MKPTYTDTINPDCRVRLALDRLRYQRVVVARLSETCGKHGREAPSVRGAWADTPMRTAVGGLLLLAASVAWLVLL